MKPAFVLTCLFLLIQACGPGTATRLSEATRKRVEVHKATELFSSKRLVTVTLTNELTGAGDDACLKLDGNTHATLDGVAMEMTEPGGRMADDPECDMLFSLGCRGCRAVEFVVNEPSEDPPAPTSQLLISDGTQTIQMDISHLMETGDWTLASHPNGHLPPGERVTLNWPFPGDTLFTGSPLNLIHQVENQSTVTTVSDFTFNGSQLSFTMPNVTANLLDPPAVNMGVARCDNATCAAPLRSAGHQMAITTP